MRLGWIDVSDTQSGLHVPAGSEKTDSLELSIKREAGKTSSILAAKAGTTNR